MKNAARLGLVALSLSLFASTQIACSAQTGEDLEQSTDSTDAIVGGTTAAEGAWPGTVALYKGSFACGGSLIHPSWVLTAAHCVSSGANGGISKVVIGKNKLTAAGGETRTVDRAIKHASYNSSTMSSDIALLHLSTPSTGALVKTVTTAQLAQVVAGANTTVVGWGTTREGGSVSNDLLQVDVPLIENTKCKTYSGYSRLADNQVCAIVAGGGKDSCQGDSGGPLFQKIGGATVQIGLVSWGIGCARSTAPGVYTRVGSFNDWLKVQTNGDVNPDAATSTTSSGGTSGTTGSSTSSSSSSSSSSGSSGSDEGNGEEEQGWWWW